MKIALAAFGIGLGLWVAGTLKNVVVMVLFAVVLAAGLEPIVERIHGWRFLPRNQRLPRWFIILGLFLAIVLVAIVMMDLRTGVSRNDGMGSLRPGTAAASVRHPVPGAGKADAGRAGNERYQKR